MRGSSDELLRLYRRIDEKDQEIQSLKNQIEDLRRAQRTPPRYRSRSRSPPPMIRKRVREEGEFIERIGSETDIYIGNFFARTVNLDEETFFQYLKDEFDIEAEKITKIKNGPCARLFLRSNEDQTKLLDNKDIIEQKFNLNSITIFGTGIKK
jgi:hypothetical protein